MKSGARRNRPAASTAVTGTVIGLALLGSAPLAVAESAAPAGASPAAIMHHPDLDWAGSQVNRHEPATGDELMDAPAGLLGLDVSSHQGTVDWAAVAGKGARFAYVKATEGTGYTNPYFSQQYGGSANAGLMRGAYHFATPNTSSGTAQADYFVAHGGQWTDDGKTLPGMLDLEWNPYGPTCYGLSTADMSNWVHAFADEYQAKTGRWPVIYTATNWWAQCTGSMGDFSDSDPLMLARYAATPGPMPYRWDCQTIWQYADAGTFPGDQDVFNGDEGQLAALASG